MNALRWFFFELDDIGRRHWRKTSGGILKAWKARQSMAKAMEQSAALHRLEGMEPTEISLAIDRAALAGHVSSQQAAKELRDYVKEHQKLSGFLESRPWTHQGRILLHLT